VIGGLIQNRDEDIETGVPLLKDIPFMDAYFDTPRRKIGGKICSFWSRRV
jgi:type II secretory pathway component GspD/PulD (secretin)